MTCPSTYPIPSPAGSRAIQSFHRNGRSSSRPARQEWTTLAGHDNEMALIASIFQDHAAVANVEVMRVAHSARGGAMIAVRSTIVDADPVAVCSNDREL